MSVTARKVENHWFWLAGITSPYSRGLLVIGILFLAPSLLFQSRAGAQVLYGSLTGTITDSTGAPVPNAKANALNVATGVSKAGVSNDRGIYSVDDLDAGTYTVTVSAASFADFQQTEVPIQANQLTRVNIQLNAGRVTQSVTVSTASVELKTDRPDVSTEISDTQLANLPTGTARNFESIYRIVPGFTTPATQHVGGGNAQNSLAFNVNGGDYNGNNTNIDGASTIYPWLPGIATYIPPQEAIQSVNIVTNTFDAEQGLGASSQINVYLKSGTNQFHGAAWEYNTVSALQAKNYFYLGKAVPKYILNQFGFDFGGPILRDKLFFFGDWEHYSQRNLEYGYQTVPTAAMIAGNFAGTGTTIFNPFTGDATGKSRTQFPNDQIPAALLSPAAQKLLSLVPAPNVSGTIANDYFNSADYSSTRDNVDIKINYNPNARITTFGSYSISPNSLYDPQALGAAGGTTFDGAQPGPGKGRTQRVVLGSTVTLTPRLLFDGNIGFTRLNVSAPGVGTNVNYGTDVLGIPGTNSGANPGSSFNGGIPYFELSGFSSLGLANSSNPFQFRDNVYIGSVNMGWTKGSHALRFGGQYYHFQMANFQANTVFGVRGGFDFTGGLTALNGGTSPNLYNSLADLLLGQAYEMGEDHQYIDPGIVRENVFGFFARDQWQVTPRLTATFGLRYEIYPYTTSDHGIAGISYNPSTNLVSLGGINGVPRNTGVNTGNGVFQPRLGLAFRVDDKTVVRAGFGLNANSEDYNHNVQVYPIVVSEQYPGANSYSAGGNLTTGIPAFVGPNLSAGALPLPTNVGTFTYAPNYRRGYVDNYNLAVERTLGVGFIYQIGYVGSHTVRAPTQFNINTAAPGTGTAGQPIHAAFGNASSIYSYIPFAWANYNALQTQVVRRVKRASIGVFYTYSKTMDFADNGYAGSPFFLYAPVIDRNYALASFDLKHNFETYATYDLPFGKGQKLLANGIMAAIAGGWEVSTVLSRLSGQPFTVTASGASLNAPGNSQTANQLVPKVKILGGHGTGHPYFDPNAFAPVTTVGFGTGGRDDVRGPGFFDLDANIVRTFDLTERFKLQFRAEAFGLTNTPQFANPSANVSNATFTNGVVTNLNGYDTITSSTGQRQLRFAAKLTF
jgi:hypothetical protein